LEDDVSVVKKELNSSSSSNYSSGREKESKMVLCGAALQESLRKRFGARSTTVDYKEYSSDLDKPSHTHNSSISEKGIQKRYRKQPQKGKTTVRPKVVKQPITSTDEESDRQTVRAKARPSDPLIFDIPTKLSKFQGYQVELELSDDSDDDNVIDITSGSMDRDSLCLLQSSQEKLDPCPVDPQCTATYTYPLSQPLQERLDSFHRIEKLYKKGCGK
jgi:hypothetical protein